MNQRKAGTILTYIHILLANTVSLIYTPYMLRVMGQSEYGLYGTANSFISYLSILSFGIGGAYIRFNAQYRVKGDREGEKRLNGMFLVVYSILSMIIFAVGMIFIICAGKLVENTFTDKELWKLRIIMFLLVINMMITFIFNVVTMALQAYEKYIFMRIVTISAALVTPIVNVIVLKNGGRSVAISAMSLVISIICYIIYFVYARKAIKLEFEFKGFQKKVIKELFIFSSFLFLNSITDQITFSTDNLVLSAVSGTTAVAIYSVGANFKNYFQQFSSAISGVFGARLNLMVANNSDVKELDEVFIKVGRIQFYVVSLILMGYLSIGKVFVEMWAGSDYENAYYIGLLLMISVFVPAIQNVGLEIQKAMNKHKARTIVYFWIAIVNIGVTIPFSIRWGGIGAALATMISMFLGRVVFMNYYYQKYMKMDIVKFWKSIFSILPGYIIPGCLSVLINLYWKINSFLDILVAAILITLAFTISVWLFSMNIYEKDVVRLMLRKKTKR